MLLSWATSRSDMHRAHDNAGPSDAAEAHRGLVSVVRHLTALNFKTLRF